VLILDDGRGMNLEELRTAMRPGSRNPLEERSPNDLGRFGLGLKTASLSQCRNLCVASKPARGAVNARTWDLDTLANSPEWRLLLKSPPAAMEAINRLNNMPKGTAVVWSDLDRLIGGEEVGDAVAHTRFNDAIDHVREHLSLTFHRYLEERAIKIDLNDKPILPWNPFMNTGRTPSSATPEEFIPFGKSGIKFQGFILPHKDALRKNFGETPVLAAGRRSRAFMFIATNGSSFMETGSDLGVPRFGRGRTITASPGFASTSSTTRTPSGTWT